MKRIDFPIDFVLTWVDGTDSAWQAEKSRYYAQHTGKSESVDASDIRYRDWDNLRYWFRSVERYAPWVNKVHFVTCGQIPAWLNPDAPRLNLVHHRDYIPAEYLPTFSSHPIELNLHRIPGLSEHFVYFNDDSFLTAPTKASDFFRKGLPCDSLAEMPTSFVANDIFNNILVNHQIFLNHHFNRYRSRLSHPGKWFSPVSPMDSLNNLLLTGVSSRYFFGMRHDHLPQPYLKSTLEQVWQAEPELLNETCLHKFRDARDINQYVFKDWQLLTGNFTPYNRRKAGKAFFGAWDPNQVASCITKQTYKMICMNDSTAGNFDAAKEMTNHAFARMLGEKSSFEL